MKKVNITTPLASLCLFSTAVFAITAGLSVSVAAVGEVTIDGEPIPATYFSAYEAYQVTPDRRCSPVSDARVRDGVIDEWLMVLDGRKKQLELEDYTIKKLDEYQQEINSATAKSSEDYRSKREVRALITEAHGYRGHIAFRPTDEQAEMRFNLKLISQDPALFGLNVVRFNKVQFNKSSDQMQQFVTALEAGESWETLVEPLDAFARNHDNSDEWHTIADMDEYTNTTIQRMVGDGSELKAGDVIGPIEMYAYSQLFRIEEKKTLPFLQLDDALNGEDSWALELMKKELRAEYWSGVRAELRRDYDIREDGKPVIVPDEYASCVTE